MNQAQPSIDYRSKRYKMARLAVLLSSKSVRAGLMLAVLLCLSFAIVGLIIGIPYVAISLVGGVGSTCLMVLVWFMAELRSLPTTADGLNGKLDWRILGRLRPGMSPISLTEIVIQQRDGIFFINRYGISPDYLKKLSSDRPEDTDIILGVAHSLQGGVNDQYPEITSGYVLVAILMQIPEYEFYLSQLHLDKDELISGLVWQQHNKLVRDRVKQMHFGGGIGRDLGFGWTPQLDRYGNNISRNIQSGNLRRELEGHEEVVGQMVHLLAKQGTNNVLLVGPPGSGKTTVVYDLARRMLSGKAVDRSLRFNQVVELDASNILAVAKGGQGIEGLINSLLNEAYYAKNTILFFDDAQLFMQDGVGSVDLSSLLLRVVEASPVRLILAIDQDDWLQVSTSNPALARALNKVMVAELDHDDTVLAMQDHVTALEHSHPVIFTYQALKAAYSLADRFINNAAFPGRALKLLESGMAFLEDKYFVTESSIKQAIESEQNIKVQVADSQAEKDTLINLETKIHQRMIGQADAVVAVSSALRRARSGVGNQNRPVGTFLFLGPTGVGKTELAKSLAWAYFDDERSIVRVDLNEYASVSDSSRLIQTAADNPTGLMAQITQKPFSVVLLDEIEKAHDSVLSQLLQLLDEGTILDANNKQVNFRESIIIATSNAGSDFISEQVVAGTDSSELQTEVVNHLISSATFRPEFINRFDEVVVFKPLSKQELMQVVDLIIASLNKSLAQQKVSVQLDDSAKLALVDAGYDPKLGARPLRRVVQRSVENIVASQLLSGQLIPGQVSQINGAMIQQSLSKAPNVS